MNTGHNHDVSSGTYQTYHEASQVSDDEVLSTVHTLHRAGTSRKRTLEYIAENTHTEATMKDIHNLVNRLIRESYAFHTMKNVNGGFWRILPQRRKPGKGILQCRGTNINHCEVCCS
eukprot:jgi/Phyca11/96280/e_gw1.1.1788.1